MPRYLTPSKIGLLALASLHMEGVVPLSQTTEILSFLICLLPDASYASSLRGSGLSITTDISAFETALSARASAVPGRTVWDLLLQRLWSINSASALNTFLTSTPLLLVRSRLQIYLDRDTYGESSSEYQGRIRRTSPLGAFIRRTHIEYTRLQFDGANALWQKFLTWRLPTRQAFKMKNPADGPSALDINLSGMQIDSSHPIAQIAYGRLAGGIEDEETMSTSDVERLMQFQAARLQSMWLFLHLLAGC
jgi:anaphase-promoting complex subunit 5